MRALLISFFAALPALASFPNGYDYCKVVTTSATMVSGSSDLTNYPLTVILTDAALKTVGNGGLVNNASGFDIGFYPDCSGSGTALKWEMESYTASTGAIVAHVLRPTLSHTTNDTIGMYYGGSFSSFQSTASAVWNAGYKQICHLADGATLSPSCVIGTSLTLAGSPAAIAGKVDGGASFNGSTQTGSAALNLSASSVITVEFWLNKTAFANDDGLAMEFTPDWSASDGTFIVDPNSSGSTKFMFGIGQITGGSHLWADAFVRPSTSTWHHIALVMDRATPLNIAYVDGTSVSLTTVAHASGTYGNFANNTLYLMSRNLASLFIAGSLDEIRISSGALPAAWLLTEYRNQNAPGTYITEGAQQSSLTARHRVIQ